MTLHHEFNAESGCHNCAAFSPWTSKKHPGGTCHRRAPTATTHMESLNGADELMIYTQSARGFTGISWPNVDDSDEMFCCEWLPKPKQTTGGTP